MKLKMMFVIAMVAWSFGAVAQMQGPPMAERYMNRMKSELSLSDEQVARLTEISKQFWSDNARLNSDTTLTRQQKAERRKTLAEDREEAIRKTLTEDQYKKWTSMREHRGPRRQVGRARPAEDLKSALGLSDEQTKKLEAINASAAERLKNIRTDSTLTRQDRMREQRKIAEDRNAAIKELLSKEQYEKYLALRQERMKDRRRSPAPGRRPGK